ncbi:uncharacterized protein LOC143834220 isoform X2 [Paroedura picta]|uniref:uncharacterized protein LOC143834220 isoform X2 n=1 Tax=Paroedura picta TaxID=143630 RepID=UPI0040568C3F
MFRHPGKMETADSLIPGPSGEQELEEEPNQFWDAQFQEFLNTFQAPCSRGHGPQQPEPRTAPAASEGLTEPGGLGASQPQSIPTGEAKQDHEGKEKKQARTWDTVRAEMWRWRFRSLSYQEGAGPRETCRQLQELCCQWLRPKRHSKEQILDQLALEQLLAVLPPEMQRWVSENNPENCAQAVSLAEEFLKPLQGAKGGEPQIQGSSEDTINGPETSTELPGRAKTLHFSEANQDVEESANVSGDERLSKTEEVKPSLESPEEKEPEEMTSEAAKEKDSPCSRKGAESQNRNNQETEATEPGLPEGPHQSQGEATALQQVKGVKCEPHKENLGPSPPLLTHEESLAVQKTYKCWHCGLSFGSSLDLLSHERTHMAERLYKCWRCGESKRVLTGEAPLQCSHCGHNLWGNSCKGSSSSGKTYNSAVLRNSFKSISGTKTYQRVPRGEKPYKGSRCGDFIRRNSDLGRHETVHPTELPYCGESCSQNLDLVEGERSHAEKEAFPKMEQGKDTGVLADDGWLSKTEEELQTLLESPEEEKLQEMASERAKEEDSLRGRKGVEDPDGNHHETEAATLFLSEATDQSLSEAPAPQQMEDRTSEAPQGPSPHLPPSERSQAGGKTYECWHCSQSFWSSSDLLSHERIHVGESLYKCAHCGKQEKHKPQKCSHCGNNFGGNLQKEIPKAVEKPYKCTVCGDKFMSNHGLKTHQRIHREEKLHKCLRCGEGFRRNWDLEQHERTHPALSESCEESFAQNSDLVDHEQTRTAKEEFTCFACGKAFDVVAELAMHIQTHKESPLDPAACGKEPYTCSYCDKSFRWNYSLVLHERTHTGEKSYPCSDCGRAFHQKLQLIVHVRKTHAGQKSHECSDCGMRLSTKYGLLLHQKIHSEEEPCM